MQVRVEIQSRSEALGEADTTRRRIFYSEAFGFFYEVTLDLFRNDSMNRGEEFSIGMDPVAHRYRKRDDKLPVRDEGQYVIYEMMSCLCHTLGAT